MTQDAEAREIFKRIRRTVDAVESWGNQPPKGPQPVGQFRPPEGDAFYNDSGEMIPAYSVAVYDGFNNTNHPHDFIKVKKPSTTFNRQFLITPGRDVAIGAAGFFAVQNLYLVRYDSGTPARGEGWGPKPSQWTISKGFPGCTIAGIVDATNKIALVSLESPITHMIGKTTGAITGGTSSTTSYRIHSGVPFTGSDAGFTTVTAAYSKVDIDSGLWIKITYLNGYPVLEQLECNA